MDEIRYDVQAPWPTDSSGTGKSLTRTSPEAFGRFPTSWIVAAATPDDVSFIQRVAGDANEDGRFDTQDVGAILDQGLYGTGQPATWQQGDWTGDGLFDRKDIVAALQTGSYAPDALAAPAPRWIARAAPGEDGGGLLLSLPGEDGPAPGAADPDGILDELFGLLGGEKGSGLFSRTGKES